MASLPPLVEKHRFLFLKFQTVCACMCVFFYACVCVKERDTDRSEHITALQIHTSQCRASSTVCVCMCVFAAALVILFDTFTVMELLCLSNIAVSLQLHTPITVSAFWVQIH